MKFSEFLQIFRKEFKSSFKSWVPVLNFQINDFTVSSKSLDHSNPDEDLTLHITPFKSEDVLPVHNMKLKLFDGHKFFFSSYGDISNKPINS